MCVASFPGPREGGKKVLGSTVCACTELWVTESRIHKGEGANDVFVTHMVEHVAFYFATLVLHPRDEG